MADQDRFYQLKEEEKSKNEEILLTTKKMKDLQNAYSKELDEN